MAFALINSNGNQIKRMREYGNDTVYSGCSLQELLWWTIKLNLFILKKEIVVKVKAHFFFIISYQIIFSQCKFWNDLFQHCNVSLSQYIYNSCKHFHHVLGQGSKNILTIFILKFSVQRESACRQDGCHWLL